MDAKHLKSAKLFIWDIDNVLYPYDAAFWNMICETAAKAAVKLRACNGDGPLNYGAAKKLAQESQAKFGKSTEIFVREFGLDPEVLSKEFLAGLDYNFIKPNHQLLESFRRAGVIHAALTHNSAERAQRIIRQCGLASFIPPERIVSVTDAGLTQKHQGTGAFDHVLQLTGIKAEDAVMIEDTHANLAHPEQMRMQTVLIGQEQNDGLDHAQHRFRDPLEFMESYCAQVGHVWAR